ncbi:hypothetical protein [Almyronema epifaneia]|uniref:Uncharacterized protein n=1 Tax=Almyronema epifaneia S1 TaxID=2991925 RepID=A0ABW6IDL5_9CYAN
MPNSDFITQELEWKQERLTELERQRKKQNNAINKFENMRNRASSSATGDLENIIIAHKESLKTICQDIKEVIEEIETFKEESKQSVTSQTEETSADFIDDEEINKPKADIILGEYGNTNNAYWSDFQEEEKGKEEQSGSNSSQSDDIPKKVFADKLIRLQDPIKKTIFYLVTFFPRLSRNDFRRTFAFLLKDQFTYVDIPVEIPVEDQPKTTKIRKSLYEVWQEDSTYDFDRVMEECHLTWSSLENSIKGLDFELPYLRDDLKSYFENRGLDYSSDRFERARLLLLDFSNEVVKSAVEISIEMAVSSDHSFYGEQWLTNILNLFSLFNDIPKLRKIGLDISATDIARMLFPEDKRKQEEFRSFSAFIGEIKEDYRGQFLISRVAILIQRMLDYPILNPEIDAFLNRQIDDQNQEALLALVALLQSVPKFDWLFWIRKLLNEPSRLIGNYTRQILFSKLRDSQNDIYEILREIRTWVPEEQMREKGYNQVEVFALCLIYKYSLYIASELEQSDFGCYPPKYQLFADLDHDLADENLKLLVEWVFHPGHRNCGVRQPMREASLLIADWFSILCGFDSEEYNPQNLALANRLLTQVMEATTLEQQNELVQQWSRHVKYLADKSSEAYASDQRIRQEELIQKRYSIVDLIEQFENFRVNEF